MVELGTTSQEEGNQPTGREVPLPLSLEGNLALIVGESLVVRGKGGKVPQTFPQKQSPTSKRSIRTANTILKQIKTKTKAITKKHFSKTLATLMVLGKK